MAVFLDGMRLPADFLEEVRLDDLAGVEVYKRSFDVPWEFRSGFGDDCGVVAMWSRY